MLPTGTVTFLFTDIEGSTQVLEKLGGRYAKVLTEHNKLLRAACIERGGHEVSNVGDAFTVAFPRAHDAVAAAVAAQQALHAHPWQEGAVLRIRMGLHTGEPLAVEIGYVGMDVHRGSRICAAGHGGQILLSETTHALVADDPPGGVTFRDLGKHRLKDLTQPHHLFQVIASGLPVEFPRLNSLSILPNNLPFQLSSFIGREREIAEVKRRLGPARLLTLTGAGGAGKTRLALQAAAELLEEYPDGVWWTDLASLSDPALVPKTVAVALGMPGDPGASMLEALADFARPKTLLLLLDNCEYLLPVCAQLAETLLQRCPNVRVLATSREALSIRGEAVWRVPSLSLPERSDLPSVERVLQSEAVRLFVERAVLVEPRFAVAENNASAVAQVCTRLDGVPLAIELASARVNVLTVQEIATRLDDRFRLLTSGHRTEVPRHRTLSSALDWSHEMLSETERILLRRLSVFAGSFTLESAEGVCAGDVVALSGILDLLTELVDKSLVEVQAAEGETRYRLLETIRQYARDKLHKPNEEAEVRKRHLAWYVRMAERAQPELVHQHQGAWFDRLETEHDNLRASLAWSLESGDSEGGLRLATAVWRFWFVRGYVVEGRSWLEQLLGKNGGVPTPVRARGLNAAGSLAAFGQGDYVSAHRFCQESLTLSRQIGPKQQIAHALTILGYVASNQGDDVVSNALFEESLALWREAGDVWGTALSLHHLGNVGYYHADYTRARTRLDESLAIWRDLGDRRNIAMTLTKLGLVATAQGDLDLARSCQKESLEIRQAVRDTIAIPSSLEGFAVLAMARGRPVWAAQLLGAAAALREAVGAHLPIADRVAYERTVAAARSALGDGAFAAAWAAGRSLSKDRAIEEAMEGGGEQTDRLDDPGSG